MPRLVPLASVVPRSVSVPGYRHFLTPLRKLIVDYDPLSVSQNGIRWVRRCLCPYPYPYPYPLQRLVSRCDGLMRFYA
jgi:hypothetical protein